MASSKKFEPLLKPKPGRKDPEYMTWMHQRPCCITGHQPISAHHVRHGNPGLGLKPDDRFCVPILESLHLELHTGGSRTFERKYGVDLLSVADYHWRKYCDEK